MVWNIVFAVVATLAQFFNSWLGLRATMHPPNHRQKKVYNTLFIVATIISIIMIGLITYRSSRLERAHFGTNLGAASFPFLIVDKPLAFNFSYKNVGSGAAINARSFARSFIEPDQSAASEQEAIAEFYKRFNTRSIASSHGMTIQRDQSNYITAFGAILSPEDINNLGFGRKVAYVIAIILFEDDFGKHTQRCCQSLQTPQPGGLVIWKNCEQHNDERNSHIIDVAERH